MSPLILFPEEFWLNCWSQAASLINVTPRLTLAQAQASVQQVANYALAQNGTVVVETLPSWNAFFTKYVSAAQAVRYTIMFVN